MERQLDRNPAGSECYFFYTSLPVSCIISATAMNISECEPSLSVMPLSHHTPALNTLEDVSFLPKYLYYCLLRSPPPAMPPPSSYFRGSRGE